MKGSQVGCFLFGQCEWVADGKDFMESCRETAQAAHGFMGQSFSLERLYLSSVNWHHFIYCVYFKNHNLQQHTDKSRVIAAEETAETITSQKNHKSKTLAPVRSPVQIWECLPAPKIVIELYVRKKIFQVLFYLTNKFSRKSNCLYCSTL